MCTRNELNTIIYETQIGLKSIFGNNLERVMLYGSYARGDENEESDIDVMALVNLPKEQLAKYRRNVSDFSGTIDLEYGVLLSIKLQDKESFERYANVLPFFQNVAREGINSA